MHAVPRDGFRAGANALSMMDSKTVVVGMARTPFGRLSGGLASLEATTLGAAALVAAIQRSGVDPAEIEHLVFGQVLQAGAGQNPARQVGFKSGLAKTVTAETVNKVCASGLLAAVNAARLINEGSNSLVGAGGMESMSNAPYLLKDARSGYRFGDGRLIDAMIHDGLWDYYFPMTMAAQGTKVANELGVSREEQDRFAYESHRRATEAQNKGGSPMRSCRCALQPKPKARSSSTNFPNLRARVSGFGRLVEWRGGCGVGASAFQRVHAELRRVGAVRYRRRSEHDGRSR